MNAWICGCGCGCVLDGIVDEVFLGVCEARMDMAMAMATAMAMVQYLN